MKKEDIILAVFKLVYGGDEEPTTEVERLENDGILGALDAASDLVRLNVRRVDEFASTKNCVLKLKEPEYSNDELIADCRELISTLNMTLRALVHKKNALYDIIKDLELEKLKADDSDPWRENVQPYVDKFEKYARELLHDAIRRYENGELSRADLDEIVDYLGFEERDDEED